MNSGVGLKGLNSNWQARCLLSIYAVVVNLLVDVGEQQSGIETQPIYLFVY